MCGKPKTYNELIPYLAKHPYVRMVHLQHNEQIADDDLTFVLVEYRDNREKLLWEMVDGSQLFFDIACPPEDCLDIRMIFHSKKFVVIRMSTLNGEEFDQLHIFYRS